jgi:hypothetical protein
MGMDLVDYYSGRPILRKHSYYTEFAENFPDNTYRSFSFTRNPLDKLVTLYLRARYPHEQEKRFHWLMYNNNIPWQMEIFKKGLTFEEFCAKIPTWKSFKSHASVEAYKRSMEGVDFIGRYENINEDWSKALKMFGIPQTRELTSQKTTYGKKYFVDHYTKEVRSIITDYFSELMDYTGYEFPEEWH